MHKFWIIADDGCTWLGGAVAIDLAADTRTAALVIAPAHVEAETVVELYQLGQVGGSVVT